MKLYWYFLINQLNKLKIFILIIKIKFKPSKKARAGIIDKTNIDETKTHVVSPVFMQLIVSFEFNIFIFQITFYSKQFIL
jgi:hypothetical protein